MNFKNMGSDGRDPRPPPATPATPLALARQLSVYSLTFDEFQNTLGGPGRDFGSMNMDEFIRNIWTAEESQAMASALGATADSGVGGAAGPSAGLQRQGSLTLPRTLSQKTVDEVWRDLLRESSGGQDQQPELQQQHHQQHQQRQPTLGEMTLEEFLVRAGVVREETQQSVQRPVAVDDARNRSSATSNGNHSMFFGELPASSNNNPGLALGFGQAMARNTGMVVHNQIGNNSAVNLAMNATVAARPYGSQLPVGNNVDLGNQQGMRAAGMVGMGDPAMNSGLMSGMGGLGGGGAVTVATVASPEGLGKGNGDLSSLSPVPYVFGGGLRGRKCSGAVEKVVERRQRRMIKNRESAARSRARKQAYTMELEAEVNKLKEQNQELQRKQAEIVEMQKNQVLEMINQQRGPKKLCLRRTQTGPW